MFARCEWPVVCACVFVLGALVPGLPGPLLPVVTPIAAGAVVVCALRPGRVSALRGRLLTAAASATAGVLLGELVHVGGLTAAGPACGVLLAVACWARRRAGGRETHRPVPRPVATGLPVEALSIDELCRVWQRSYLQLIQADGEARDAVVALRRACLDELERRDRPGFARWLDSGARASGDPRRFVRSADAGRGDRPRAA